jgi:hypothetical protein
MIRYFLLSAFLLFANLSCNTHAGKTVADGKAYKMPDEEAIQKAVAYAYRTISFKEGETLNYDSIKAHFIPKAQFIHFVNDSMQILSLDEFVNGYKQFVESAHVKSFKDEEITGRTDQYGKIAERISTYQSYMNNMDTVAERGVNSFQLINTPQGWRVSSIIWDIERPGQPIPGYYLKSDYVR